MVEYSLTPLGETLVEPRRAVSRWSTQHLVEVTAARARYDARHGSTGGDEG